MTRQEIAMAPAARKPTIYLKLSCPFCLKLRIFLTEARMTDQVEFVVFKDGDERHRELKKLMKEAGTEPSFPAMEESAGEYMTDSDRLIEHFAKAEDVDPDTLPLLNYYEEGVFKRVGELFEENKELKERLSD